MMIGYAMNVWSEFDFLASTSPQLIFNDSTALRTMPTPQFSGLRVTNNDTQNAIILTSKTPQTWVFTVSGITITPTAGATYTNNSVTYTVVSASITAGSGTVTTTGSGAPLTSGTLTKASGTGDASITFSAFLPTSYWKQLAAGQGLADVDCVMGRGTISQLICIALAGTPLIHCELLQ
jgi:hypothetical protein